MAGAARRVRNPLHGQQRSCGLCGLACRAAVCGARLHDADRPADLQPLAGPRVRPDGQRPRVRGPLGPGPADLLLSLLRADAARRRDRPPGRSRPLPAGSPVVSGYTEAFWAPARGGIALVRAAPPVFSLDLAQTATGGYVPGQISALAAIEYAAYAAALANPAFQGIFEPVPLLDAKNAGVRGVVVAWTGLPDDEVVNQYNPFTTSYPAASGPAGPRRSRLPGRLGRRLDRHRAGRAGRGRPGNRHARAHRGHHRRRGDRDGLGLAARLGGHRREHHHQHPHRRAERDRGERRARAPRAGPAPGGPALAEPRHVFRAGHGAFPAAAVQPHHREPGPPRGRPGRRQHMDARPPATSTRPPCSA